MLLLTEEALELFSGASEFSTRLIGWGSRAREGSGVTALFRSTANSLCLVLLGDVSRPFFANSPTLLLSLGSEILWEPLMVVKSATGESPIFPIAYFSPATGDIPFKYGARSVIVGESLSDL